MVGVRSCTTKLAPNICEYSDPKTATNYDGGIGAICVTFTPKMTLLSSPVSPVFAFTILTLVLVAIRDLSLIHFWFFPETGRYTAPIADQGDDSYGRYWGD